MEVVEIECIFDFSKVKMEYEKDIIRKQALPLFKEGRKSYMLLEAALIPCLTVTLEGFGEKFKSLYTGKVADDLEFAAPYIVEINPESKALSWVLKKYFEVALFLQSEKNFDDMWKHCRKFSYVADERGKRYYFRYFNPKVFKAYVTNLTPEEEEKFFTPFSQAFIKDEYLDKIYTFKRRDVA